MQIVSVEPTLSNEIQRALAGAIKGTRMEHATAYSVDTGNDALPHMRKSS